MHAHGPRRRSRRGGSWSGWIVTLLVGSSALAGVLAWQAIDAERSHRATTEAVLRDYSGLAAEEYIRRAANEIGYIGHFGLITTLRGLAMQAERLPAHSEVAAALGERARRAIALLGPVFRLEAGELRFPEGGASAHAWLERRLPELLDDESGQEQPFEVLQGVIDGRHQTFLVARIGGEDRAPRGVVGYEVAQRALGDWFRSAFERGPLLPSALNEYAEANRWIGLTVYDADGAEAFQVGERYSTLTTLKEFGETYNGILRGHTVRAAIDPEAAAMLVIGGLPRSRLPLVLGLLALTTGLLFAATRLLLRERALADLRSDFVSRVSHELRTPLTQIRMFAETLLLGRVRSEEEARRSLEIVDREARRLGHLVENILQFSRSERDTLQLERRPRRLASLISEVVEQFRPLAGKGIEFRIEMDEVEAEVDEDAIRQVVLNLLDNAVKYGPANQVIEIGLKHNGNVASLSIDDEGPGVPKGQRQRVWDRFSRLQQGGQPGPAGTGIGLAVVRELVARHDGRAWIESGARGGARFVVELPMLEAQE